MAGDGLHEKTASELAAGFASGAFSPVEVATVLLDRIEALDSRINAFSVVDRETSLRQAEESTLRWKKGEQLSPLDGVPVAVKDLLLTRGWPTLRGSRTVDPAGPWDVDAPAVARLREGGAVLIGKTTTPEFGWKGVTDSPLTGVTRNPWNPDKTPGGSSGGAAAALVARFCPLALGSDGGGSIRMPAHFCGVYGLKPSFGRVPAYPVSLFGTLSHIGPMARTVNDAALLLDAIAGADPRDWFSLPPEDGFAADRRDDVRGKRIAYSPRLGWAERVDPEVEALVAAAVGRFAELGAEVVAIDPPMGDPTETFRTLWWAAAGSLLRDMAPEQKAMVDPGLRRIAEEGMAMPIGKYLAATTERGEYGSRMRIFMEDYDFLLTPSVAVPAFEAGALSPFGDDDNAWLGWTPFTYPINLTQQPAASIPCGFTGDGLPVGLQIVGRMFDDRGVLAASRAYEKAHPLHNETPPGF